MRSCYFWVLGFLFCLIPPPLFAQTTYTWTGKSGSSWGNPENWNPIGVPKEGDSAILDLATGNTTVEVSPNDFVSLNLLKVASPAIVLKAPSVQVIKLHLENGALRGGFYSVNDGFVWNGGRLDGVSMSVFGVSEMYGNQLILIKSNLLYQSDLNVISPQDNPMSVIMQGGSLSTYFGSRSMHISGEQDVYFEADLASEPITSINISGQLTKAGGGKATLSGVLMFGDILVEKGSLEMKMQETLGNPFYWFTNAGVSVAEGGTLSLTAAHEKHEITSFAAFSGAGDYFFNLGNWNFTVFQAGSNLPKKEAKQNTSIGVGGQMFFVGGSASIEATADVNIGRLSINEGAQVFLKTNTFVNDLSVSHATLSLEKDLLAQRAYVDAGRIQGGRLEVRENANFLADLSGETRPMNHLGNGIQFLTTGSAYVRRNVTLQLENKAHWTVTGTARFDPGSEVILSDGDLHNQGVVFQEEANILTIKERSGAIENTGNWDVLLTNNSTKPLRSSTSRTAQTSSKIASDYTNKGILTVSSGSLEISGTFLNEFDATLAGSQDLVLSGATTNRGIFSPGNDQSYNRFGTLTIVPSGDPASINNIDLQMDLSSNQQDLFKVNGTLDLAGSVNVVDVDGSVADEPIGRVFNIIEAENLNFNKPSFTLPPLGEGKQWSINREGGIVFLRIDATTPTNQPPVAVNDDVTIDEDTDFPLTQLLTNDFDPDKHTFSLDDRTSPKNGTFVLNEQQQLVYLPDANFFGTDTFTYRIKDSQGAVSSFATVRITIRAVNDAPVAKDDGFGTSEDTPITMDLLKNDSDLDNDPITIQVVSQPQNGTFTFSPQTLQYVYSPKANYYGEDQFTYQAKDPTGALSVLATVFVKITPINDAPLARPNQYQTGFNQRLTVAAPGILDNDEDVDGDQLTAVLEGSPASGILTLLPNGGFTFDPAKDFTGEMNFGYFARDPDGAGSDVVRVVITVGENPNQPPVAVEDRVSTNEDTPLVLNLIANDTDPNQDPITIATFTSPKNGTLALNQQGQLVYTPNKDFNGNDAFVYVAKDPSGANSNEALVFITIIPINDAPTAADDQYVTNEDTQVLLDLLGNDKDVDGDLITVEIVDQPKKGQVFLNQQGQRFYHPNTNINGLDQFTYRAKDLSGAVSQTVTVTITISPINDAPIASNDAYETDEDFPVTLLLTANDADPDNDFSLSDERVSIENTPKNGVVAKNQQGAWVYTPNGDFNGSDTFTYSITDPQGLTSNHATVTIIILPVNDVPSAKEDQVTTPEDVPVSLNLTVNDSDPDGDVLTAQPITQPKHGALALVNNLWIYTPNKDFFGADDFTYQAKDPQQAGSNTAQVKIIVTPVNDPPVATADNYTTDEDVSILLDLLANDSDAEGGTLTVVIASSPKNGTFTFDQQGQRIYKPNPDFNGSDEFMYLVQDTDNARSEAVKVNITVRPINDAPIATENTYQTNFNTTLNVQAPGILANDSDVDGDVLEAVLISNVSSGTLTLLANGGFTFVPLAGFTGEVGFTYQAKDPSGARSGVAQVTITVGANPNRPPVAVKDEITTDEDTAVNLNLLANDTDPNQDPLTIEVLTQPAKGLLSTNQQGQLVYTPNKDVNGVDTFTYRAKDPAGATSGAATVTLTIRPVNDPPIAQPDRYSTNEDTQVILNLVANDSDVDGDVLTVGVVSQPTNGTLGFDQQNNRVYKPNANFFGADQFTYRVTDTSGATSVTVAVDITVVSVNDAPIANNDVYQATAGTTLDILTPGVLANDTDVEQTVLTAVLVTNSTTGNVVLRPDGGFSFTTPLSFSGTAIFTYQAQDANGARSNSATVTLQVQAAQNRPPNAVDDNVVVNEDTFVTLNLLANDTDPENDELTVIVLSQPQRGILLDQEGSLRYVGNTDINGSDQFTYQVRDGVGNLSNIATVRMTILPVNDPPNAVNDESTTDEDVAIDLAVLGNDVDVDLNDVLRVASFTNPPNGSVIVLPNGALRYTPVRNFNGLDFFTYVVQDAAGERSGTARVNLVVRPVNDPPKGVEDTYQTAFNQALTIASPGVLENDNDPDTGDKLVAILEQKPESGDFVLQESGGFTFTPAKDFSGAITFRYVVRDAAGASSTPVNVTIDVGQNPNRAPVALDDQFTTLEDQASDFKVLANDRDPNGDPLEVTSITQPTNGSVVQTQNGLLRYTPKPDFNGSDTFGYVASDPKGLTSNAAIVHVSVTPVNDPPIAVNDAAITDKNAPVMINVLANDRDIDGDQLTFGVILQPTKGTLSSNTQGQLVYTPNRNVTGEDAFTYAAVDPSGAKSNTATVTLNIRNSNSAPIATADRTQTAEDTPIAILVLQNDSDPDEDALTILLDTLPTHGTVEVLNSQVQYKPNKDFNGFDQFRYRVQDTGNLFSLPVLVTVEVTPVNDAPIAQTDAYEAEFATPINIPAPGVLANDRDVDGDPLTAVLQANVPSGTLTLSPDGSVLFVPASGFFGDINFTYRAKDATGAFSETVTVALSIKQNPNRAPVALNDAAATNMNLPVTVTVLQNDQDLDGDRLLVTLSGIAASNGTATVNSNQTITYAPNRGFLGTDRFEYTISDGKGGRASALVQVEVQAITYRLLEVNSLGNAARAWGINDAGEIVGVTKNASGQDRAFFWNNNGLITIGNTVGQALGLSETGIITGYMRSPAGTDEAFLWRAAEPLAPVQFLGHLGGGFSIGNAVSNSGKVIGASFDNNNRMQAFSFAGKMENLHTFGEKPQSEAFDINLAGVVTGLIYDGTGAAQAFRNQTVLAGDSRAYRINNLDVIVGSRQSGEVVEAVRWNGTTATTLTSLSGTFAEAYGISDMGWIVGAGTLSGAALYKQENDRIGPEIQAHKAAFSARMERVYTTAALSTRAVLWLDDKTFDLNALIPPGTGWVLKEARDVNRNGQIVGYGLLNGKTRAFLLNPATNTAPIAIQDGLAVNHHASAQINVLDNDLDPDADRLQILGVFGAKHGVVEWQANGQVRYVPNSSFKGADGFTYVVGDGVGGTHYADVVVSGTSVANEGESIPVETNLLAVYPNPATYQAEIVFRLANPQIVNLTLFDLLGRKVQSIRSNTQFVAGEHHVVLNNTAIPNGVYFVRMEAGHYAKSLRVIINR
ncbi:MAG: tandem-95 repeat protein [Rhodothermia bacterium]|nr:tandem-95 repeat protein [Rhodothermia bacterium]